jgi:hypothetical protein
VLWVFRRRVRRRAVRRTQMRRKDHKCSKRDQGQLQSLPLRSPVRYSLPCVHADTRALRVATKSVVAMLLP